MSDPKSWNTWHGCRKYSEGCDNCYMFFLDKAHGVPEKSTEITRTKDFQKPLQRNQNGEYKVPPGFILSVNMTSDTFLEEADVWRAEMWEIIRKRPDVIFYLLTKRVPRMRECLPEDWGDGYDNVILNMTAENQARFDERWPIFESIPAKHKGLNLAPLLGPIDITPALESGQIEQVDTAGEGYGGRRPCRHEWMEAVSNLCERYRVNFTVNAVGAVYVKDGSTFDVGGMPTQAKWAFRSGLSRFFGRPGYDLHSPEDGHLLSKEELYTPMFNKNRCFQCPNRNICPGCVDCGTCKDVILVDTDGNPIRENRRPPVARLDDFFDT